jgi:hypothetical protein
MHVTANTYELLNVLEKLTPMLDKSGKDLVSRTVLVHSDSFSDPTGLAVIAVHNQTRVKLWARGTVQQEGEICLSPELLIKLLETFKRPYIEHEITFSVDKITNQVSVAAPRLYRASIQGVPTDNFPKLVTFDSYHNQIAIDGKAFLSGLNLLTDLKQADEGVWLTCRNGQFEMCGGAGQVVLSDIALFEGEEVEFVGFGLAPEAVKLLISVLPDDGDSLSICTDENGEYIYFDTRNLLGEQIFLSTRLMRHNR